MCKIDTLMRISTRKFHKVKFFFITFGYNLARLAVAYIGLDIARGNATTTTKKHQTKGI